MASTTDSRGLERNAIGLTEVLFQSITHMAPAVATALSIGLATTLAGGITPLAVVFALVACLFTAYSMSQLARHMPSAGGMYTYVARGLGSFAGWLLAWAFLLAEPIVPAALFASFGLFGASLITLVTGFSNDYLWLVLTIDTPSKLSDAESALLRDDAAERGEDVDPPNKSLFGKIKSAFS